MKRWFWAAAAVGIGALMLLLAYTSGPMRAQEAEATMTPTELYAGKVNAPEFPEGMDWINVEAPLTMAGLRGKVVLLDFWTYGCINCIHIIPDLKRLEAEFASELVVIGVHSAKFANEGSTDNIRYIVQRYGVEHPVVNDKDFVIWQTYAVRAWPTVMVINPVGRVLGYYAGEGVYEALQPILKEMITAFDQKGQVDRSPLQFAPESAKSPDTPLVFPGKVLADGPGNRLFIADTNHHRVIVADLTTYEVKAVIGGKESGFQDGNYQTARFNWVHGMALNQSGDVLYVADTGNHLIRAVDLTSQTVITIAGTGVQNQDWEARTKTGPALTMALNSPWDVTYHQGMVYIAMAGPHQLWALDIAKGELRPHSGSGHEGIVDGTHAEAQLAQPSGIINDGTVLYFADAESSSIRRADIDPTGEVTTIVGLGLFEFGDIDGVGDEARLQHALGLTLAPDGKLYVADTYNSKIKVIDPQTRESLTFAGGKAGLRDGAEAQFYEPGGISYANGKLYVADTNNHAIRVIDLTTRETSTVQFPNLEALNPVTDAPGEFFGEVLRLDPVQAAPGAGKLTLESVLPEGYKMNDQAPFTLRVYNNTAILEAKAEDNNLRIVAPEAPVSMPISLKEGSAEITFDAAIFYCESVNESLCFPSNVRFVIPLTVIEGAGHEIRVRYTIVPPNLPKNTLDGQ